MKYRVFPKWYCPYKYDHNVFVEFYAYFFSYISNEKPDNSIWYDEIYEDND